MSDYRKVAFNQLSKADIIFTTSNSVESAGIRQATNSIISHTILVTKYNFVIEATGKGVDEHTWAEALIYDKPVIAIVMRRKGLTNEADQDKVVNAARKFQNFKYDYYGAAGSGMYGNSRNQIAAGAGCSLSILSCSYIFYEIAENAKDENADKRFSAPNWFRELFRLPVFPY